VKTHSWGEFVFDFEFAEIAQRSKARWYPKLVGMVPATPVPAWRVMTAAGEDSAALERVVLQAAVSVARDSGFGGVHLLWPDLDFAEDLRRDGTKEHWVEWAHQSYLWTDEGYGDFDGYLDSFSKNMRRNVKRERTAVREAGITTRVLSPGDLRSMPRILPAMAELYEAHSNKFGPWAAKFLEKEFFLRLPDFMDSGWAISAAFEDGEDREPLGLAFLLEGKDRLYGRYYGAYREVDCLHFELCYYLPIEYALGHGVGSFDPGMGSSHKARRGFRSRLAPSFHLAFDRRIAGLMERSLPAFNAEEALTVRRLDLDLPFKRRNEA
jgi:predicted N-acyltransferase